MEHETEAETAGTTAASAQAQAASPELAQRKTQRGKRQSFDSPIGRLLKWPIYKLIRMYALGKNVTAHKSVQIGIGTLITAPRAMSVGEGTIIGKYCTLQTSGSIGRGVLIANSVGLVGRADHDSHAIGVPIRYSPWIWEEDYAGDVRQGEIVIEDDVWIGYGAILLSPLRIGRGAIISAGALVVRDVPPYTVVGGVPARPVGRRFTDEEIVAHEAGLKSFWQED